MPDEERGALGLPKRAAAFKVGQSVECTRLGPEGTGVIIGVSSEFSRGLGTKLYPAFLVELEDGRRDWFKGISLTKIKNP